MTDAFGYRPELGPSAEVVGVQVAEGKRPDTLQPVVFVYLRFAMDDADDFAYIELPKATDIELPDGVAVTAQLALPLSLDQAESLRSELERWIKRAREKHWES
jgi:hypothetical protein